MTDAIVLAVDGGATKTAVTLRNLRNEVLFKAESTGSNYQAIGEEPAFTLLHKLLTQVMHFLGNSQPIQVAVFALAGIDTKYDAHIVQRIVTRAIQSVQIPVEKVIIENDAQATMLGVTKGLKGALMIAGTGAIAYGSDGNGEIFRVGGGGHRAGDEGSGYWIGREILHAVFRMEDGRGEPTLLKSLVFDFLKIHEIEELTDWLYRANYTNAQIASLASLLKIAVAQDDPVAKGISLDAAAELTLLGATILRKISAVEDSTPIFFNGGALLHNPCILKQVSSQLLEQFPNIQITSCTDKPIEYIVHRAWQAL